MSSEEAVDRLGSALGGEKKKGSWKEVVLGGSPVACKVFLSTL